MHVANSPLFECLFPLYMLISAKKELQRHKEKLCSLLPCLVEKTCFTSRELSACKTCSLKFCKLSSTLSASFFIYETQF